VEIISIFSKHVEILIIIKYNKFVVCYIYFDKLIFGHARWGGSGALNLQPAIAGLNSSPRLFSCEG